MAGQSITLPELPNYGAVPVRRFWPVVTLALLALNFAVFGVEGWAGGVDNVQVLLNLGASYGPYIRRGEYWRLVIPMFLHSGWMHILGNSYALFILGPILERVYGLARYACIYIAAGIGGAALSMSVSRNISVGASAAIFGIAGAMLVTGFVHRDVIPRRWARSLGVGILPFIVIVLLSGFTTHGVDNWGHVGGLATGVVLAFLIPPPRQEAYTQPGETPSRALVILPLAVVLLAMAAAFDHYRSVLAMDRLLTQGARFEAAHQYASELASLRRAVSIAPHEEQPHEELGKYYLLQKDYDMAIGEFQQAIRLTEGDEHPRLALGMAYQLKGDPGKAQQIFEDVLGKAPRNQEGQKILAENRVMLADMYAKQKAYGEAIRNYQEALRLAPNFDVAHNNLAWLYATSDDPKFRDPQAALSHAQRAVDLTHGMQADFLDTLAEAQFINGHYKEAIELQKRALALDPGNAELQQHMLRYRKAAGL